LLDRVQDCGYAAVIPFAQQLCDRQSPRGRSVPIAKVPSEQQKAVAMAGPALPDEPIHQQLAEACAILRRQLRAGASCRAEDLLAAYPAVAAHTDAALELIYTEFVLRDELGQALDRADWLARFPQWRDDLAELFDVHTVLAAGTTAAPAPAAGCGPGTVIGPYKLLEQIGEGGFGVVYMAEQQQPVRRKVALKILKPGMDTRQVVARFEAERQALALMDHPNIAQVHDGGETASGRPYFVMELVRGIPITDFCDHNHLNVRARLELFVSVCQAVQHAHQKGIIHRDLKPSNVLVTLHDGTPVAKVIDFGTAKATGQQLTDKTLFTNFVQMIGTPLYMSPEQAQMSVLDVDTRSDIYSLGVLLYELLTGTTPFDQERLQTVGYDEVRRIIREEEPPRPSARLSTVGQAAATVSANRGSDSRRLRQLFRSELDWIVMKCLEKDRNRRYETANGLARDIERYMHDEPVYACPPSASYRLRKFARRHRAALFTAELLVAMLLLGSGISIWQAIAATLARNAETEARRDLEVAKQLAEDRADQIAKEKDRAEKAQKLADDRAEQIAADLKRLNVANALVESGRLHAGFVAWLEAERDFTKAVQCAGKDNSSVWTERGHLYIRLGLWDLAAADFAEAYKRQEPESIHAWVFHALLRCQAGDTKGYRQICKPMAERFERITDPVSAETVARGCLLVAEPVVEPAKLVQLAQRALAGGSAYWRLYTLALAYYRAGLYEQAVLCIGEAQALNSTWNKTGHYAIRAMAHHRQGQADLARKDLDAAAMAQEQRIDAMYRNPPGFMPDPWYDLLASNLHYREAKILIDGKAPPDDARLWVVHGRALAAIGRAREAVASFDTASEMNPKMVTSWTERAAAHQQLREWKKAKGDYVQALARWLEYHWAYNQFAWLLATCPESKSREPKAAVPLARIALSFKPGEGDYWRTLGVAEYRAGNWPAAVTASLKSVELRRGGDVVDWLVLAMANHRLKRTESAGRWFMLAVDQRGRSAPEDEVVADIRAEAATLLNRPLSSDAIRLAAPDAVAVYTLVLDTARDASWAKVGRSAALAERAGAQAAQGNYQKAAADYAQAVQDRPNDAYLWFCQATACLGGNDQDGHRRICAPMRDRFSKTNDPTTARLLLLACVPVAEAGVDTAAVVRFADVARRDGKHRSLLGQALYRDGQYERAAHHFDEIAKTTPPWGDDLFFSAMAQHRLGQTDKAKITFAKAVKWIGDAERAVASGGSWTWQDQVYIRRLYKEAEALLKAE
jgi:serine/threonine protein kinase/Flp pilus assembly protein TadD